MRISSPSKPGSRDDIARGRQCQQMRHEIKPHAARDQNDERRQHQAHNVIHEKCRKHARSKNNCGQQVRRFEMRHQAFGDKIKKAAEA